MIKPISPPVSGVTQAPAVLSILFIAVAIYRLLVLQHLEQTAALFIGLPTFLALAVALASPPRSYVGIALKVVTLALLMSFLLLGEGAICILMSAPLFYGVVGFVWLIGKITRPGKGPSTRLHCAIFAPLMIVSLEGTTERLSFDRDEMVVFEQNVDLELAEIQQALSQPIDLQVPLPTLLSWGFPKPVKATGTGLGVGDLRNIHFAGGEGRPGTMTLRVVDSGPNGVVYRVDSDESHIAHWMGLKETTVHFQPIVDGGYRVRWTMSYERLLDPAAYFGPLERAAAKLSLQHLHNAHFSRVEQDG